jgi:hypothetical protein
MLRGDSSFEIGHDFSALYNSSGDTLYRSQIRHYATSRQVAGSITDEVIVSFFINLPNPSSRTVALDLT